MESKPGDGTRGPDKGRGSEKNGADRKTSKKKPWLETG